MRESNNIVLDVRRVHRDGGVYIAAVLSIQVAFDKRLHFRGFHRSLPSPTEA
jgi:hypothetical protein